MNWFVLYIYFAIFIKKKTNKQQTIDSISIRNWWNKCYKLTDETNPHRTNDTRVRMHISGQWLRFWFCTHRPIYAHTHAQNAANNVFFIFRNQIKITVIFFTEPFFHSIWRRNTKTQNYERNKRNRLTMNNEKTLGFNRWNEIAHKLLN